MQDFLPGGMEVGVVWTPPTSVSRMDAKEVN